jgi:hypothetical protein
MNTTRLTFAAVSVPRPLLVGMSVFSSESGLLLMGGGAVCFSFGTFWNKGCYTVLLDAKSESTVQPSLETWKFLETMERPPERLGRTQLEPIFHSQTDLQVVNVRRMGIKSTAEFATIMSGALPVILEDLDLGTCTKSWTSQYLKSKIGEKRQVVNAVSRTLIILLNMPHHRLLFIKQHGSRWISYPRTLSIQQNHLESFWMLLTRVRNCIYAHCRQKDHHSYLLTLHETSQQLQATSIYQRSLKRF